MTATALAQSPPIRPALICAVLIGGTVLGMAGVDLVLPSIPGLPAALGGTTASAQLVIASYVAGTTVGLLAFGELAGHLSRRTLMVGSLGLFALLSALCALTESLAVLVALRFLQGAVCMGPAVLGTGVIRVLYDDLRAVRVLGLVGSVESLTPAFAPIAGAALDGLHGWTGSFWWTAGLSGLAAVCVALRADLMPGLPSPDLTPVQAARATGYGALLRNPTYLRYALSQACVVGGLLVFVFGAPAVFVKALGGGIGDFIAMQVVGVGAFIASTNAAGALVGRWGPERLVTVGTWTSTAGITLVLAYALCGGATPAHLIPLWIPMSLGLGLRNGAGFVRALASAPGDDDRASALTILFMTVLGSAVTALAAPFLEGGLVPLAFAAALVVWPAPLLLAWLPALDEG